MDLRSEMLAIIRSGLLCRSLVAGIRRTSATVNADAVKILADYDALPRLCSRCGSSITDAKPVFHSIGPDP